MRNYFLEFKTSPRGYKGYAGLYCRLYVNGKLAGSCGGGGYDMSGTCIGEWIKKEFSLELEELASKEIEEAKVSEEYHNDKGGGIYGILVNGSKYDDKIEVWISGATGVSQMWKILEAIGFEIKVIDNQKYEVKEKKIKLIDWNAFSDVLIELSKNRDETLKRHSKGLLKALKL